MLLKGRFLAAVVLLLAVSACSLPRGAALQSEILRNENGKNPGFSHYEVTRDLLPIIAQWPVTGGSTTGSWVKGSGGAAGQIIAPGDSVQLSIWENGENALMTSPGAPSSQLQTAVVSPQGNIFVPYVGVVKVSGMSPEHAREAIQTRLAELVPAAQVQLVAAPGRQNSVDLVSGVARPGNFPLVDRSLTVLGLVSMGGGVQPGIINPQLRLIRGGNVHTISMERLIDSPTLDTNLRGGDKLVVEEDTRFFTALGASGREELITFPKEELSALDAITLAGGINDVRANPKGVLILREYPAESVVPEGVMTGPSHSRVVFSLDLTSADGLFSASNFPVRPRDLVLATESAGASARTILALIGSTASVGNALDN